MTADQISRRAKSLTRSAAGCAFLASIEAYGLVPEQAVEPRRSFHLLNRALADTNYWQSDRASVQGEHLAAGPLLLPVAEYLCALPGTAWWFASSVTRRQLLARLPNGPIGHVPAPSVSRPPDKQERYAQAPGWGVETSTLFDDVSSYLVAESECMGDIGPLRLPAERVALMPRGDARVYSVTTPEDWHHLATTYRAREPGGLSEDVIVPDFSSVASDWDGVHLSFAGVLACDQVRVETAAGVTELQSWEAEQTVWLRPVFADVTRLPDLTGPLESSWS